MSNQVDYLPVATSGGANVDTQGNFVGSGYQLNGFLAGLSQSKQFNKVWRQASMMASAVANMISTALNIAVLDDGNITTLIANLIAAIKALAAAAQNSVVTVAFSSTPVFDASQGNSFEIVLTGNVTSSTLVNTSPGQRIRFLVRQDGTGGRTFTPPSTLPMSTINTAANANNLQNFYVSAGGSIYMDSPLLSD